MDDTLQKDVTQTFSFRLQENSKRASTRYTCLQFGLISRIKPSVKNLQDQLIVSEECAGLSGTIRQANKIESQINCQSGAWLTIFFLNWIIVLH